jgi:hypothetical protein
MRFLLFNPSWGKLISRDRRYNRQWPPLSLLNCAAILKNAEFEVTVLDGRVKKVSQAVLLQEVSRTDFILMTSSPLDRWQCPNLDLKPFFSQTDILPKDKLIICGVHGTVFPERMLRRTQAKFVIRDEPEASILDFVKKRKWEETLGISYLKNNKVENNPRCAPLNLENMPFPAYNLINPKDYFYEVLGERMALLEGSRGCPYQCPFCLKVMFGQGVRVKPISQMIDEIERVIRQYRFRSIYFFDLEFAFNKRRVVELCRNLMRKDLKFSWACQTRPENVDEELLSYMSLAGCRLIHFGIETGEPSIQSKIKKNIDIQKTKSIVKKAHELGIATACFYIVGFPEETYEEREKTLNLALYLDSTYASFHLLAPYPSTSLYNDDVEDGTFFPVCLPRVTDSEINRWIRYAFFRYYLRPEHTVKALWFFLRQGRVFKKALLFKEFVR